MKISAIKPFVRKHGFDGLISTITPLVLAPVALTGMLSNSPAYPVAIMGLWSNSLFQGVKQASPSRIVAYSLALVSGIKWMMNIIQVQSENQNKDDCNSSNTPKSETEKELMLFGKLIYPALMMITYLASGSYMAKTAKPIEGSLFKNLRPANYFHHLKQNLKAEFDWLKKLDSIPLKLNFAQMVLRGASTGLFGLAFAQSGLNFDDNPISRVADKLLWAGDFFGGATDITTGVNKDLISKYGLFASGAECAGGAMDIVAGVSRNTPVGCTARFAATSLAQLAGGLKGLGK